MAGSGAGFVRCGFTSGTACARGQGLCVRHWGGERVRSVASTTTHQPMPVTGVGRLRLHRLGAQAARRTAAAAPWSGPGRMRQDRRPKTPARHRRRPGRTAGPTDESAPDGFVTPARLGLLQRARLAQPLDWYRHVAIHLYGPDVAGDPSEQLKCRNRPIDHGRHTQIMPPDRKIPLPSPRPESLVSRQPLSHACGDSFSVLCMPPLEQVGSHEEFKIAHGVLGEISAHKARLMPLIFQGHLPEFPRCAYIKLDVQFRADRGNSHLKDFDGIPGPCLCTPESLPSSASPTCSDVAMGSSLRLRALVLCIPKWR